MWVWARAREVAQRGVTRPAQVTAVALVLLSKEFHPEKYDNLAALLLLRYLPGVQACAAAGCLRRAPTRARLAQAGMPLRCSRRT